MKEITIVEKVPDVTFGKYFCFQVNCYQHNVMCTYSLSPGSPPTRNRLMDFFFAVCISINFWWAGSLHGDETNVYQSAVIHRIMNVSCKDALVPLHLTPDWK